MNINFRGKDVELTQDLKDFTEKKIVALGKLLGNGEINAHVDFSMDSNHHVNGDHYKVSVEVVGPGFRYFTEQVAKDHKTAVNQVKEELQKQINAKKGSDLSKRRDAAKTVRSLKEAL